MARAGRQEQGAAQKGITQSRGSPPWLGPKGVPAFLWGFPAPSCPGRPTRVQQGHTYTGDSPSGGGHTARPHVPPFPAPPASWTLPHNERTTVPHLPPRTGSGAGADCVETRKGTRRPRNPHDRPKILPQLVSKGLGDPTASPLRWAKRVSTSLSCTLLPRHPASARVPPSLLSTWRPE